MNSRNLLITVLTAELKKKIGSGNLHPGARFQHGNETYEIVAFSWDHTFATRVDIETEKEEEIA